MTNLCRSHYQQSVQRTFCRIGSFSYVGRSMFEPDAIDIVEFKVEEEEVEGEENSFRVLTVPSIDVHRFKNSLDYLCIALDEFSAIWQPFAKIYLSPEIYISITEREGAEGEEEEEVISFFKNDINRIDLSFDTFSQLQIALDSVL